MGDREKEVPGRSGKKVMAVCQTDIDSDGIWSGSMGLGGEGGKEPRELVPILPAPTLALYRHTHTIA